MKKTLLLLVALLLLAQPSQAQSKKQLERDKARIEKEIARLNNELGKARKDSRNRTKQIKLVKQRIDERNRLIDNINSQMAHLDRQITRTEDSLRVVRGQIDSMKAEYARVVRTLYGLRENVNATSLLFDNASYNYSYLKMKYFKEYSRFRRHQATAIQRREQRFANLDLDLQRQRNEKNNLLAQQRKQRQALTREQEQHQQKLDKSTAAQPFAAANPTTYQCRGSQNVRQIRREKQHALTSVQHWTRVGLPGTRRRFSRFRQKQRPHAVARPLQICGSGVWPPHPCLGWSEPQSRHRPQLCPRCQCTCSGCRSGCPPFRSPGRLHRHHHPARSIPHRICRFGFCICQRGFQSLRRSIHRNGI